MDGGTGSELKRRGASMSDAAWSGLAARDHPALLQQIHEDYIAAGATVITTNTFGSARSCLRATGSDASFAQINRQAVALAQHARKAANKAVDIAGSISNLPPNMDPRQYPPPDQEHAELRELAELLADAGVDLIATEMLQHPEHGKRAMDAALATGLPVWLGVSCRLDARGGVVCFDNPALTLAEVLAALVPMGPALINVMHSDIDAVSPAIKLIKDRWDGPIGVYPEIPYETEPTWHCQVMPAEFAAHAQSWHRQGARLLGGCCGTTPEHISALTAVLEKPQASSNPG